MRLQVFRLRELMSKFESQKQSSKKYNHTRFGENSWGYIETREDGSVWELLISCLLTDFRTWLFHRRWWLKKGVAEQILIKGRRNSKQTWSGNPWNANSSSLGRVLLSQTHLTHFKFWLFYLIYCHCPRYVPQYGTHIQNCPKFIYIRECMGLLKQLVLYNSLNVEEKCACKHIFSGTNMGTMSWCMDWG